MRLEEIAGTLYALSRIEDVPCSMCTAVGASDCAECKYPQSCMKTRDRLEEMADAVGDAAKRIIPEGMEWPTVDGKPVDFVTGYEPSLGVLEAVSIYSNGSCEVMSHDGIVKNVKDIHIARPKVLDADGVEIRVGETVWDTETGCGRTVRAINDNGTVEFDGHENRGWFGKFFTHRAPVLAADGRPLREGETVYVVGGDGPAYVFDGMSDNVDGLAVLHCHDKPYVGTVFRVDQLTHEPPDTWERLYLDMDNGRMTMEEFVRRCRALAERGE